MSITTVGLILGQTWRGINKRPRARRGGVRVRGRGWAEARLILGDESGTLAPFLKVKCAGETKRHMSSQGGGTAPAGVREVQQRAGLCGTVLIIIGCCYYYYYYYNSNSYSLILTLNLN